MGASVAAASNGCNNCCGDEGRGQLTFREEGAGGDEVHPDGVDPLSEFLKSKPSSCIHEAATPAKPLVAPPQPALPDGASDADDAFLAAADAIFAPGGPAAASFNDSSSERSEVDGQDSAASTDVDSAEVRLMVERFVRGLVRGSNVSAVAANGDLVDCLLSIDREITTLSLQRTLAKVTKKREILLSRISKVTSAAQAGPDPALPLDDTCVALYLEDGQMVGFSFPDLEERMAFLRCLSMFVGDHKVTFKCKPHKAAAAPHEGPTTPAAVGAQGKAAESESFGLEDPDNISVPDCQETLVPFEFEVEAQASHQGTISEVGTAPV